MALPILENLFVDVLVNSFVGHVLGHLICRIEEQAVLLIEGRRSQLIVQGFEIDSPEIIK